MLKGGGGVLCQRGREVWRVGGKLCCFGGVEESYVYLFRPLGYFHRHFFKWNSVRDSIVADMVKQDLKWGYLSFYTQKTKSRIKKIAPYPLNTL